MIRPQPLRVGDRVAIVSPAGALQEPQILDAAAKRLASWGLEAVIAPHAATRNGYFAGSVEERAADILAMLRDDSIKAILCSYGGYGCVHLLPHICEEIARNPKWLIGISDCSALLAAWASSGVMSMHAVQCRHLAQKGESKSSEFLRETLFGWQPHYSIPAHPLNCEGSATGTIVGGNLSVLSTLINTPYDILKPEKILFIEDITHGKNSNAKSYDLFRTADVLPDIKAIEKAYKDARCYVSFSEIAFNPDSPVWRIAPPAKKKKDEKGE